MWKKLGQSLAVDKCFLTPTLSRIFRPSILSSRAIAAWHPQLQYRSQKRLFSICHPHTTSDTIYALSTAKGRAGIAVVRISGPGALDVYRCLCPGKSLPKPRYATVRSLQHPKLVGHHDILDSEALVLHFPSPKTVTGEDVLELHIHGGGATVKAVLAAIPQVTSSTGRIRYAEPGEFTRRAFLNGRLDLAQVEALSNALAAETEQQRKAAVRGQSGVLGKKYEDWRMQLLHARAEIEALIDFSEDQHFDESPADLLSNVVSLVEDIVARIRVHEAAGARTELLRSGIRIALIGPPNSGKSSLMNLIVGREASIVSHEAGTTRDIVEASLDIRGYLCSFADTAGFRDGKEGGIVGAVEKEGIRRARQRALESDVVIVLAPIELNPDGEPSVKLDPDTLSIATKASKVMVVVNKTDLVPRDHGIALLKKVRAQTSIILGLESIPIYGLSCLKASCSDGQRGGLPSIVDGLIHFFSKMTELPVDIQDLYGVTARQTELLADCRSHLEMVLDESAHEDDPDIVLVAENLRVSAQLLAKLTGRGESSDIEEVLGVIFEKFCVGK